jgi:hypothetical protein
MNRYFTLRRVIAHDPGLRTSYLLSPPFDAGAATPPEVDDPLVERLGARFVDFGARS